MVGLILKALPELILLLNKGVYSFLQQGALNHHVLVHRRHTRRLPRSHEQLHFFQERIYLLGFFTVECTKYGVLKSLRHVKIVSLKLGVYIKTRQLLLVQSKADNEVEEFWLTAIGIKKLLVFPRSLRMCFVEGDTKGNHCKSTLNGIAVLRLTRPVPELEAVLVGGNHYRTMLGDVHGFLILEVHLHRRSKVSQLLVPPVLEIVHQHLLQNY